MDKLTGNEPWVLAALEGYEVYADGFPIVHIELTCGLVKVDVCNEVDVFSVDDCKIQIGFDSDVIEDNYEQAKQG